MNKLEYKPYTYVIGWPELDLWYYGVRYHKKHIANPCDLWKTYFTSSDSVHQMRKYWGEPTVIQVRKIFSTFEAARDWETRVLKRLKVRTNNRWLNKCSNHKAVDQTGKLRSIEAKKRMSVARSSCVYTEEGKAKLKLMPKRVQSLEERRQRSEYWKIPQNHPSTKGLSTECKIKLSNRFSGSGNPRFDNRIYTFKHINGSEFTGLRYNFIHSCGLNPPGVSQMINHNEYYRGWFVDRAEFSRANFAPRPAK